MVDLFLNKEERPEMLCFQNCLYGRLVKANR